MVEALLFGLLTALIAFTASSLAIPLVIRIGLAFRAVDYPGGRRHQDAAIPRLGGVALIFGFFVGGCTIVILRWRSVIGNCTATEIIEVFLAVLIIFLCGLLEDIIGISPLMRILMQTVAALFVINVGWCFHSISVPFIGSLKLGMLTGLISLVWIVGVTNAINLIDGLDGLAGGVVAIISSSMLIFSLLQKDFLTVLIMGAVTGACLGFLRKNWAPAKIYLGDAGSLTLGFILSLVSIRSSIKAPATVAILIPILALGLPVIDTLLVMIYRFTKRSKSPFVYRFKRMFKADRSHLHHLIGRLAQNRCLIVLMIYCIVAVFCGMALVVSTCQSVILGLVLLVIEVLVIVIVRWLGLHGWTSDRLNISRLIISRCMSKRLRVYTSQV